MTLRLTNSEMQEFRRCKRKWWLKNYRRMSSPTEGQPGSALSLGNVVHDALAAMYDPEIRADPVTHVELWAIRATEDDPFSAEGISADAEMAKIMLTGYQEWLAAEGADMDLEIQGTERFVEVPLVVEGHEVTLLSKLDAPVRRVSDGAILAFEHKTTGSFDKVLKRAKLDTQFLTEHLVRFLEALEKGMSQDEAEHLCQGVLLNMLRKVKRTARANPPFYLREPVTHNVIELRNHWRHVVSVAKEIEATKARLDSGEDHHSVCPPNPTDDCSWDCPFYAICVMADDGSDFEGALDSIYDEKDPLERYAGAEKVC
jgi:hypothetical protein